MDKSPSHRAWHGLDDMYHVTQYMPQIPSAFMDDDDVRFVLSETLKSFQFEEQEAIFFFFVLDAAVQDIAMTTQLMPGHVASVINLYTERLDSRLRFFKRFIPYDHDNILPASDFLLMEAPA